jgi:hypothetical protein
VHERLKQYAEFIQSPKDYVIGQALRRLFRKDKDFAAWAESRAIGIAHDPGPSSTVTPPAAINAALPSTAAGSRARVEKSA